MNALGHLTAKAMRVYTPQPLTVGETAVLEPTAAHHLVVVCRCRAGDRVVLFNGDGAVYAGTLAPPVNAKQCTVSIDDVAHPDVESPLAVSLIQAIGKGDRMDWAIQKAVELGVASITPLISERVTIKLDPKRAEKRQQRWQSIVVNACEQSGRVSVPPVHPPMTLAAFSPPPAQVTYHLDPQAEAGLSTRRPNAPITLLVGPEGGFSADEVSHLQASGSQGVRLGPRILRTETAGVACLAAMQALWGDFLK